MAADTETNPKLKRYCRIVTACVVIAVVWGALAQSIIFYYLDLGPDSTEADICTSENYTGSICREVLQVQQSCLPDRNTTNIILIATDPTTRQLSKEEEAVKLIEAILSQSPTSKCVEELIPFLCFYIFPLCDSSGRLYQPSSVDCSTIIVTNGTCANEIEIVTNMITEDECQVLPEMSTALIQKCNGGMAVLVLSCIEHKRMFSFPTVFIVYGVIAFGVSELLLIIGYSDRTSLYCSSRDLLASILNETLFCTLQGLVFTYALLVQTLFWFFHFIILFWGIKFPFHAKSFETRGYSKYIHIVMVVLAISMPCGHIAAVVATGGVTMASYPPLFCLARNTNANLYSFIFPICIINGAGILLLLLIIWRLITTLWSQQKRAKISGVKEKNTVSAAKVKVQIVLLYVLIITLYSLPNISVSALAHTNFMERLFMYFECESQGIQPGRTCERMFDRSTELILNAINSILFCLFPLVTLVFLIDFRKMRKKFLQYLNGNSCSKHHAT